MAVFRIEKTRDYTVMSNHHLRNTNLSLKAKGLLSLMLSLPEEWDYTTKGLARICKDGVDSISNHGVRGYLLGAGSEHFGRRRPVWGNLGLHGVHGASVFRIVQNRKSLKVPVWGALKEV